MFFLPNINLNFTFILFNLSLFFGDDAIPTAIIFPRKQFIEKKGHEYGRRRESVVLAFIAMRV